MFKILIASIVFLVPCFVYSEEFGCSSENLINKKITYKNAEKNFTFSSDCLYIKSNEMIIVSTGKLYINVEAYWPGLISKKKMLELMGAEKTNQSEYFRSVMSITYFPVKNYIENMVKDILNTSKFKLNYSDDKYLYFDSLRHKDSLNPITYIIEKNRMNFYVSCAKNNCILHGANNLYKYDVYFQSVSDRDWGEINRTIKLFLEKITST